MNVLGMNIPIELLVALMSLLGGAIGAFILQVLQRWHQASERNIGTRKQVYFEACDALAMVQASLINMLNNPLSENKPDPNLAAALMRLHLVGQFKIVKYLMEFQSLQGQALLDMGITKLEIENIQGKLKHADHMYELYSGLCKEWTDKLSGAISEESEKEILSVIKVWEEKRDVCSKYKDEIFPLIPPLQIKLLEKSSHHIMKLSVPAGKCIVEMRKDLGIPFSRKDTRGYFELAENYRFLGKKKIKTFIRILSERIKNDDFPNL